MPKLAVGVAWTSPFIWSRFTETALNLTHPEGYEVKWFFGMGWCPARRHTDFVEKALAWGADLILLLGADQVYESDCITRLVGRFHEGYPVVVAAPPCRGYMDWNGGMKPFQPMVWRFTPVQPDENGHVKVRQYRGQKLDPDMIEIVDVSTGPEMQKVNFIGSGVLLYHRDHVLSLKKPWFFETIDPETYERQAIMDINFIWRLQTEAGAMVWLDRTIKVKHIHPFEIDDTFQNRFLDWMVPGVGPKDIMRFSQMETPR